MINPEDEILPDFRASCTKEEAVAKMLGWMHGPIRRKYIQVTENGISADQLPFLHSLEGSLQDQLMELREAARQELIKAADAGAPAEALQGHANAVVECEELMKTAASYLIDINDEIAKGESSALRIDRSATDNAGVIHLTLKSIDQWAKNEYSISILNPVESKASGESTPEESQQEEAQENGSTSVYTRNLLVSFALLIEEFAKAATKYHKGDDTPNVINIAILIEKLASDTDDQLKGQNKEAIRKRISKALRTKKENVSTAASRRTKA